MVRACTAALGCYLPRMGERERDRDGRRGAEDEAPDRAAGKPGRRPSKAGPDGRGGQRSKGERPGNHRPRQRDD